MGKKEELKQNDEWELEVKGPIVLSAAEQETVINFSRTDEYATVSTTDSTMKTKFDKLVASSDMWECIKEDGPVKFYKVKDKTLLSFRKDKVKRELTEEQKIAAAKRLRASREKALEGKNV